jgi:pimeloyl-ACP methyl ester carboxylesterase
LRGIGTDPANARLSAPPRGRAGRAISADGTALHIEAFGPEDGPLVVLAHGWTEQLVYWTLVIDRLVAAGHRVVAYDLRGHGHSQPAHGDDYALVRFGEDLEAVLAAVARGGERALLAGHSLGAMSVVAWAEQHDVASVPTRRRCSTPASGDSSPRAC